MGYYNSTYAVPDFWKLLRNGKTTVTDFSPIETEDGDLLAVGSHEETTSTGYAGAIGIGTEIGKGIGQAVGGYMLARATATALSSQAAVSEDNARVAQFGVEQAFKAGEHQIAQVGYKQAETKARQRAAYAANGIAIGVGSSAEVMASTDIQAEADKAQARTNALAQAWGYRRQRIMSFASAEANRIMASAAKSAGRVNMYAGLASTAFSAWAGYAGGGK